MAFEYRKLEFIKYLEKNGFNIQDYISNKEFLFKVLSKANPDIINYLQTKGADFGVRNNSGETPLFHIDDVESFKLLVKYGAKINAQDNLGNSVAHHAFKDDSMSDTKSITKFKLFIQQGLNIYLKNNLDETVYSLAKAGGFKQLKSFLNAFQYIQDKLKNPEKPKRFSGYDTAIEWAVNHGDLYLVKELIKNGDSINITNPTKKSLLYMALKKNHIDIAETLILNGADVSDLPLAEKHDYYIKNEEGKIVKTITSKMRELPTFIAASRGSIDVLKKLSENDVLYPEALSVADNYINSPLDFAIKSESFESVKFLVENGAEVYNFENFKGSAILVSVLYDEIEILKYLLSKITRLNEKDSELLTLASKKSFKLLAQHGASLKYVEDQGADLMYRQFIIDEDYEMGRLFLENGASINNPNSWGSYLIYDTLRDDNYDLFKLLLKHKPNVNVIDDTWGYTPLIKAVIDQQVEIVKLLLEHGADKTTIKSKNGETALDKAKEKGNKELIELLK